MFRATRTVFVAWYRRHIRPVESPIHRDTWDTAEASLLSDPLEARRVDELVAELSWWGFRHYRAHHPAPPSPRGTMKV